MRAVTPFEIGLVFWALPDAAETLAKVRQLGVRAGQLGVSEDLVLSGQADAWTRAIEKEGFAIDTAVCSFAGESYDNIPAVERSVGLVPEFTRAGRVQRMKDVADFAAAIKIRSVAAHIGFVPHDPNAPLYIQIRDVAREFCDHCAKHGQTFALETGQEPGDVLLRFMKDVDRPNLKINFDPANLILYGTDRPLEAIHVLAPYIVSVHCKDGDPPPSDDKNALGKERALGQGSVDIPAFVQKLKAIGYTGILSIEREEPNADQRDLDIRSGIALLQQLTGRS